MTLAARSCEAPRAPLASFRIAGPTVHSLARREEGRNVNAPACVREQSRDGSNASRCRCAWQLLLRAAAVITRLTLMLIVDVRGVAFHVAWTLIAVALASKAAAATLVYRLRSWRGSARSALAQAPSVAGGAGAHVAPRPPSTSATGRP
jgi:hypothetical protein